MVLVFTANGQSYGIDIGRIHEVVTLVTLRQLPHTPGCLAGLMDYHGSIVPVLDATLLIEERPSKPLLSTRIIIIRRKPDDDGTRFVGLLAEGVTETITCEDENIRPLRVRVADAPWLRELADAGSGPVQLIDVDSFVEHKVPESLLS
jgi:chemotaxis-related protein WspB